MKHLDDCPVPYPGRGACFGFSISSQIPLACLREDDGPRLAVDRAPLPGVCIQAPPIIEWQARPGDEPFARLYQHETDYWLWAQQSGWTRIDPVGHRITVSASLDATAVEEHLWAIPISLCLLQRRDLALHAAAIDIRGSGILLAGPGGSGKSTLSAGFIRAGHRLLAEDVACVRTIGFPASIPGPAMLRLRRDVCDRVAPPGGRIIRRVRSRVTYALSERDRGGCRPVPLRAVFLLDPHPDGRLGAALPRHEALRRLWPLTFRLPGDRSAADCFAALARLVASVPVRTFARPPHLEELPDAVENLTA